MTAIYIAHLLLIVYTNIDIIRNLMSFTPLSFELKSWIHDKEGGRVSYGSQY